MIARLDHIGIAVDDLATARRFFEETLGLGTTHTELVANSNVRAAKIPIGEAGVELLEPVVPDSPVAKFLYARGVGIHHIAVEVDDVKAHLDDLANKGVSLIDRQPRSGSHGERFAFLDPQSTGGVFLELCQH